MLRGWRGEGVESRQFRGGLFQFSGKRDIRLLSPSGLGINAEENPYLRIRLRTYSPRVLRVFWVAPGRTGGLPFVTVPLRIDNRFHTYWVKLTTSPGWHGSIEQFGLTFSGRPGWIEIEVIEIGPFSPLQYLSDQWREFWINQDLHPGTINSLSSPLLFGKPLVNWLSYISALILFLGALFYLKASKNRKAKVAATVGLLLLVLWLIYDMRETYSQYQTADNIYLSYVRPPIEARSFPALGDFYRFVEFARSKIPEEAVFELLPRQNWPFDCRLKYFLYPRKVDSEDIQNYFKGSLPKYYLVYKTPSIIYKPLSGRLLTRDGNTVFAEKGSLIGRYDASSFIYRVARIKNNPGLEFYEFGVGEGE